MRSPSWLRKLPESEAQRRRQQERQKKKNEID